jgi:serine/threonine protein kinase/WD40 repeat protein
MPSARVESVDSMSFAIGTQLGPYEILEPIGAGGMGQVWKARDTRLDRIVAIKTTQERFSDRFEREARAVAALNHPNICQIYDVGPDYLVMEFVEGKPVAPVDSARKLLDIAVQIADGLAAAHAAKIIHRDLKPDNILITRDGRVKILDFGLAKRADDLKHDDKTVVDVTEAGSTVGTVAYMSPEQARGQTDLTPQSDQFSLGLVLYELSAGKKAFKRDSPAETMTAIIREDPEPLPETAPGPLRWIIERLLQKEPSERYDSTRDLYRELKQIRDRLSLLSTVGASASLPASTAEIPHRSAGHGKSRIVIAAIAAAVVASIVAWVVHPAAGSGRQKFTPMEVSLQNPSIGVWSSDGKAFAYSAGTPGARRVMLRYLNSPTATPITRGSDGWSILGFSPDSKRVMVTGKNPQGDTPPRALFAVPVFGGEPEMVQPLDSIFANMSRDGKNLVIVRREANRTLNVYTASPPGSELKRYSPAPFSTDKYFNGPSIRFSPDGSFLVFTLDVIDGGRQIWKLPYPPGSGTPQRILKNTPPYGSSPTLSFFPGGRVGLITQQQAEGEPSHLWITGIHSGRKRQLTDGTAAEATPSVSPDGKEILFQENKADYAILSASLADATVTRLISSEIATGMPDWARSQEKFVYESDRSGSPAIWMRVEGYDRPLVTEAAFPPGTTNWFMDPALSYTGDRVIYTRIARDGKIAPWISSVSGGPPVRLTNIENPDEFGGSWSPDGSRVAYIGIRNGYAALMLVKTSGEASPTVLRNKIVGGLPVWSPDGQWIAFNDAPGGEWTLISPDGKTVKSCGESTTYAVAFSPDSKLLYGIRPEKEHRYLYSLDIATKTEKIIGDIGQEFVPNSYLNPGVRLSLSPDGKHVLFPSFRPSASLWMLEGFQGPMWTERLREMLPW